MGSKRKYLAFFSQGYRATNEDSELASEILKPQLPFLQYELLI